ncbi:hypothetical protein DKT69_20115 [Micromonospora sicca]|uniref:Uncharacterized protein n=1 Tax=Micromonospora sicca TaxID=2202420 RepID=A0A317DL40_9ACTN|nr:hypothetical protein [Micromonospora sp. 4G51]PWR13635.1 hypothetical protein DKT69_20115 [Micromonospora sp. 4G51]
MLDEQLQPIQRLFLDVPPTAKLLAASPDLATVVVTDTRRVIIMAAGRPIPVEIAAADSATLLPGGRLLVTAPTLERLEYKGREYDAKGEHLVFLVDLGSGHVLDQAVLDAVDASVTTVPHPHDGSVVLDAAMGQDGALIYVARVLDDRIKVELVAENVVAASFAPSGDRLLLMPHPSFDNKISVLEWPSQRPLARLHADDLAIDDFVFTLYGCFLSDRRVLLDTYEHGLLLCSGELSPVAWISLNPPFETSDVEVSTMRVSPEAVFGVAEDVFAADIRDGTSLSWTLWRIPPSRVDAG